MIRKYRRDDYNELLRLRCLLFFDYDKDELADEITTNFNNNPYYDIWTCFVFECENGKLGGFIELGFAKAEHCSKRAEKLRDTELGMKAIDRVERSKGLPLIEAWIVDEDLRGKHIGTNLMSEAEKWVKANGCNFVLSDTDDYRERSKTVHKRNGYVYYHKDEDGCNFFYKHL